MAFAGKPLPIARSAVFVSLVVQTQGCIVQQHPAWQNDSAEDASTSSGSTDSTGSTGSTDESSTGGNPDMGAPGDGCIADWFAPGWTFEEPEPVTQLNSADTEGDPFVTAGGTVIYFASSRPGGLGGGDVYTATRPDTDSPFDAPMLLEAVNSSAGDWTFAPTPDGLMAFLATTRMGGAGKGDVWVATRALTTDPFGDLTPVDEINLMQDEWDPFPAAGGLRLYWTRAGLGSDNLWVAERASLEGPFGAAELLSVDSPTAYDDAPSLTDDERVIVFGSNRAGGLGDQDLWYATRDDVDAAFSEPAPVPNVNTAFREGETWLSPDGCELYLASDRPGGLGGWDIYRARFVPP